MPRHALPDLILSDFKRLYNRRKQRWEWWLKYGHEWFMYNGMPCTRIEEDFLGVFDLTGFGVGIPTVLSETPLRAVVPAPGTGSFSALNILGGGLRLTTGGGIGNDCELGGGDNTAFIYPWNVDYDIMFHAHFRFPNAADLANVYLLAGLYADVNNYICIRFDPNGVYFPADPNLWFVTRNGGVESTTSLGVPDNNWHVMWCRNTRTLVKAVFDGAAVIKHASNIPTVNLTHYCLLETQEAAAKNFDFRHLIVLQDQL